MTEAAGEANVPRLSVVVPCFNEEACLATLHERVSAACRDCVGRDYEVILVNDGSRDGTWSQMLELAERDPNLLCIDLARNHGQQMALTAGLWQSRGDRILILDADLQDPPELVTPMMAMMDTQDADVVYGQRRSRAGETIVKTASSALFYRVMRRLTDVDIPQDTGDFRLMSRRALDVFLSMPETHRFVRGMVAWIGMKQVPFLYDRDARLAGVTKYPISTMLRLTTDAITGFSTAPLRLASWVGMLLSLCSLPGLAYAMYRWLAGEVVPGWTSLMVVVLMVSGVQLLVLGVMGEYLGRLYMEVKRRPLFVVRRIATSGPASTHQAGGPAAPAVEPELIVLARRQPRPMTAGMS